MLQSDQKVYYFDNATGIRSSKNVLEDNHKNNKVIYDYQNNLFYGFQVDQHTVQTFAILNFKKGNVSFGFEKNFLSKRLNAIKSQLYGGKEQNNESNADDEKNLIERIMLDIDTASLIKKSKEEKLPQVQGQRELTRTLILGHIQKASTTFEAKYEELRSQGKNGSDTNDLLMSFFKFPNSTYLSSSLFR